MGGANFNSSPAPGWRVNKKAATVEQLRTEIQRRISQMARPANKGLAPRPADRARYLVACTSATYPLKRRTHRDREIVDILAPDGNVIHTYPVTLNSSNDADFLAKGLEAAASGRLVPNADLSKLTARMPHSRGGPLAPYGDQVAGDSQTKLGLAQEVREKAYHLWEQEGRPEGRSEEYWHRALEQHLRERAHVLWEQQGSPESRSDENHRQVRDFEAN